MEQITVSNITIDVVRKDIKNLHLGVYPPTGRVRIAAPLKVTNEAIRLFAVSKIAWIKKHQRGFEKQERQTLREFITGESHYFNGKRYLLNVIADTGPSKVHVRHKYIDLYVKEHHTTKQRAAVLNKFYRNYLKEVVPDIIATAEKTMGVKLDEYSIKQMKTKWGTCNIEEKRIWILRWCRRIPGICPVDWGNRLKSCRLLHSKGIEQGFNRYFVPGDWPDKTARRSGLIVMVAGQTGRGLLFVRRRL